MRKHALDRIDTDDGWLRAVACAMAVVACSPGAPATESRSNVPDFSTIPGVGRVAPNEPSVPAAGAGDPGASASNEGSIPVGGLDPSSQPDPASDDEAPAAVGSANSNAAPGSDEPAAGEPSSDPSDGSEPGAGEAGSGTCALDVTVTTTAHGGRYTPRNVGAIWIADAAGSFVKSLDVWGNRRLTHVEAWNAATEAAGVPQDRVDAVTGATSATHRTHVVSWDCTDHQGQLVPDGSYRVYFEVTEANAAGPNHFETFEKGAAAVTLQASATNFAGIELAFQP
jgi:hypothetical protein